jgi:hypothetical protein
MFPESEILNPKSEILNPKREREYFLNANFSE